MFSQRLRIKTRVYRIPPHLRRRPPQAVRPEQHRDDLDIAHEAQEDAGPQGRVACHAGAADDGGVED